MSDEAFSFSPVTLGADADFQAAENIMSEATVAKRGYEKPTVEKSAVRLQAVAAGTSKVTGPRQTQTEN
jgi:hypothetical protein